MFICRTIILLLICYSSFAQECKFTIRGVVIDQNSNTPVSLVHILSNESNINALSDNDGRFVINNVCPGEHHFTISHIGCDPVVNIISVQKDTQITFFLHHSPISIESVIVESSTNNSTTQANEVLNKQLIQDNSNKNLSTIAAENLGIDMIKSGSSISTPVVHGLFGNRIQIINNGIPLSGQRWGLDHSPELDPNSANRIRLVKGSNLLQYPNAQAGSALIIESYPKSEDPHLHGGFSYAFESNGLGQSINASLQQFTESFSWKIMGSGKLIGDRRSPDYYLTNTGHKEANLALQLKSNFNENASLSLLASTFNSQTGILRGSQIANTTDLYYSIRVDTPFFTSLHPSYTIGAPSQRVMHNFIKLNYDVHFHPKHYLKVTWSGQHNIRREFDVRRSGRSEIPSLQIVKFNSFSEVMHLYESDQNVSIRSGLQHIFTDNTNNAITGILPFIPDYNEQVAAAFSILNYSIGSFNIETGIRYDYIHQNIASISTSLPRTIERFTNKYYLINLQIGGKYTFLNAHSISINSGYSNRNPGVHELYSYGLHQGVSSIEIGNQDLKQEQSTKTTLEYTFAPNTRFSFSVLGYYHHFFNYIHLVPTNETQLTIRGAFPVFEYQQTEAFITGIDFLSSFTISNSLYTQFRFNYVFGQNTSLDIPLVFIQPPSISLNLTYRLKHSIQVSSVRFDDIELGVSNKYVFEQTRLYDFQDLIGAPKGYYLLGFQGSTNMNIDEFTLRFFIRVENVLNLKYRDYLDRLRYYADNMGINATIGLRFTF